MRFGFLSLRYSLGQMLQFTAIQNCGIDHAHEQSFHRSTAKPVGNSLRGTSGHSLLRLRRAVDEGAVFDRMRQVAFLFKPPQHGAHCRFLQRPIELFPHLLCGNGATAPDDEEYVSLQLSQFHWIVPGVSVTRHNVTYSNIPLKGSQGQFCYGPPGRISGASSRPQFRKGLPVFRVKAMRSCVLRSPQSERNASRSRSSRYCSLTSVPAVMRPPDKMYATQRATF